MTTQNRQWVGIDECVNEYLSESEQSNQKYFKVWHLAYRCLMELGLDAFFCIRSVKLPVNANLTVTLPADYLNYIKVGVLNEQGDIIPMGFNSNLTAAYDLASTRLEQTQDNTILTQFTQQSVSWYNYWNGYSYSPLLGLPSGSPFIGNFKMDNANGVIVLSQDFSYEYVMLEYLSAPQANNDYYLPVQFKEAMIAYIRWKDRISIPVKTHMDNASVEARRRDYYNERRLAIARYEPIRLPESYQWLLNNQRQGVKA